MKPISGFAGRSGRYCATKEEAALDILQNRNYSDFKSITTGGYGGQGSGELDALRDAVLWAADQIRKLQKPKTKGSK